MSKRAVIRIPAEMISKLIGLPDGLEVLHVTTEDYGLALGLVVTAPDMAETIEGGMPPILWPLYELNDGAVRIVEADYPRAPGGGSTEEATVVPPGYFDELTASLDVPPEPNAHVAEAARRLHTVVRRADEAEA